MTIPFDPRNVRMAFLVNSLLIDQSDCIEWPFSLAGGQGGQYGVVRRGGRQAYAHRIVCEITNGSAPSDKAQAAHSCGNSLCVNKRHIRWATAVENNAEKKAHGTNNDGERHGLSSLNNDQAATIRRRVAAGEIQRHLAREFGVTPMVVSRIVRGESYRGAI